MNRREVMVVRLILILTLFFIPTFGSYTTLLIFESKMDPSEVDKTVRIFKQRRFKVQAYRVKASANLEVVRFDVCNETAKARNLVAMVDYTEDREINNMLHAICQQIKLPYVMMSSSHQIRSNDNQYLLQLFPGAILQLLTLREYLDVEWKANRWKEGVIILSDNKADLDNYSTLIQGLDQYFLIRKWSKNEVENFRMLKSVTDRSIKTFIVALEPKYLHSFFSLMSNSSLQRLKVSSMRLITISNQFILSHMNAASADLNNFAFTGANITTFRVKVGQNNTLNSPLMTQLTTMARELLWAAITPLDALVSQSPAWRLRCTSNPGWPQGEQMIGNLVKTIVSNYSFVKSEFVSNRLLNYSFDVLQLLTDGHHRRSTWTNNKGFYDAASKSEISEDLKFLIKNMTLRVVTIIDPPFVIYRERDESGKIAHGNDRWTGLAIELLKRLSEIRSFKYKIHLVEDGNFGSLNDSTGRWTGMIGELIDNKADIAVASLTITYDRERVIDFTTPYMSLGLSIIIKKPKLKADLFQFMAPMSTDIWWLIILAYILVSFVLFILARMSPAEWYKQYPCSHSKVNQFSLLNSFWFTFGSIVQQGSDLCPKSPATRVAGAAWWFFVLIMVASYTANLAAFLTIDRLQSDITNVEELSRQSRVTYGSLFGGSTYSFFKNSEIPTYKRMWRAMSRRSETAFVNTTEKGIERVQSQDYAFILESTLNEYYRERNCDLMPLGGLIDSRGYGIGLPSGSLLRDSLSEAVLMLKKEQWVEKQRVKWLQHFNVSKPCSQKTTNNDAHKQRNRLNKQSVGGVFVCLLVGLAIALAVCVMETCLRAFRAKYKGKQSSVSSYIHAQCRIACCTCSGEIHDPPPKDPMEEMEAPGPLLCSCRPLPPPDQMLKERHYLQNDVSLATVVSPGIPHYNRNHHSNPSPWERERLLCSAVNRQLPDNRNGVWEPRQDLDVRKTPRFY